VWIPKYRHKVFSEPYSEGMNAIIQKNWSDYDIDIIELKIPDDHTHMRVRHVPKTSPSHILQVIKIISAREFFKLFPDAIDGVSDVD
jgi:putative transposase